MNSKESVKFGIDWGGTKIEIIALDGTGNQILRTRSPTPKDDYQGCLDTVRELIESAESELGCKGTVGFGIPGTISPATNLVKKCEFNLDEWSTTNGGLRIQFRSQSSDPK